MCAANAGVPAKPIGCTRDRTLSERSGQCSATAARHYVSASRRRNVSVGVVHQPREPLLLAKPRGEPRSLQRRKVIDEDLALKVLRLVLNAHGQHAFGFELERLPVRIEGAHANPRRAPHAIVVARDGQAAFLAFGFAFGARRFCG